MHGILAGWALIGLLVFVFRTLGAFHTDDPTFYYRHWSHPHFAIYMLACVLLWPLHLTIDLAIEWASFGPPWRRIRS